MTEDDNESYWVVVVNRSSGDAVSYGPFPAEPAHKYANEWHTQYRQTFVVGKRG